VRHVSDDTVSMIIGRSAYLLDGKRVTLTDLLDAGLLAPGDQLEFKRPRIGAIYHASVTKSGALARAVEKLRSILKLLLRDFGGR
jgi:hypothetical protein